MTQKLTEIIFLLDRSGSMAGLEKDTIGGFNAFIEKQNELPGRTILTTILFDDRYEVLWDRIDATKATLTETDYFVRGYTALLDAIGKTIINVHNRAEEGESLIADQVIFVITTDGLENASREFTNEKVNELIKDYQENHRWEFVFMGANMDAIEEANNIGIANENAYRFDATETGIHVMYDKIHEAVRNHRRS